MLTDRDATAVSPAFGLGPAAALAGPMARGQLGQVWRLMTPSGWFAVKEWFASPDLESVGRNADFSETVRAAGVLTPAVIRTPNGSVTSDAAGGPVRLFEWIDLGKPTGASTPRPSVRWWLGCIAPHPPSSR